MPSSWPCKAGPGFSSTAGNSAVPKEGTVTRCQNVSWGLSCPSVSNPRSVPPNRFLHTTEVCFFCWEMMTALQTPPRNKYSLKTTVGQRWGEGKEIHKREMFLCCFLGATSLALQGHSGVGAMPGIGRRVSVPRRSLLGLLLLLQ